MGVPVTVTPRALEDLNKIVAFIARNNPERAQTFGDALLSKAFQLEAQPLTGRMVREERNPVVRELVHGSYRTIYRSVGDPGDVFVVRFWHAARGTPQIAED